MKFGREAKRQTWRAKSLFSAAVAPLVESLEKRVLLSLTHSVETPTFIINQAFTGNSSSLLSAPYSPSQIRTAYGVNLISLTGGVAGDGSGQTIAIVDALNNPNIIGDANTFSSTYGLPQFNVGGPTLTVLNQNGGTSLPANSTPGQWDIEEALDVEWAHSIAPKANIILFEATSASNSNLFTAETTAANFNSMLGGSTADVSVVSNSFGSSSEFSGEQTLDSDLTTPANHQGVTFIASAGDSGAIPQYPSVSPNVLSVGGTSLLLNNNGSINSETAWSGSGGGVSTMESQPSFQTGEVNGVSSTNRATPDVSMLADPNTGVAVLDTFFTTPNDPSGWWEVGGTSLSAPMWAGLIAIANQGRALESLPTLDGIKDTLPTIYSLASNAFHDITQGNNGQPAGVGYDLATGLGSPIANMLVPDIVLYSTNLVVNSGTPANGSSIFTTPPTDFTITLSRAVTTSTVQASDLTVNGLAANSVQIDSTQKILTFHFNSSPVTAQGAQTISIAAGAMTRLVDGAPNVAYSATFHYANTQMQVTSTNPAGGSVVPLPFPPLIVNFSKAVDPATVNINNLTLSQGQVTGFALQNGNMSVLYMLSGVTTDGTLNVSMAAGALNDSFGTAMAAFSTSFITDIGTAAFPTPLTGLVPSGSMQFTGSTTGSLYSFSDTDSYTISLDAGQTLTADLAVAPGLTANVQVFGPTNNLLGNAPSPGPGIDALIQTVPIATSGTYTVVVSSLNSTTGTYNLALTLNAAVKAANHGGSSNSTLATAQNLDSGFLGIGGAAQVAGVAGAATSTTANNVLFSDNFESGLGGMVINNTPVAGATGMWHLSTGHGSESGHSATTSLYFGQGEGPSGGGNYNNGSRTTGIVTTPTIVLPSGTIDLDFNYILQTEQSTSFDLAQVQISTDGGNTFATLASYNAVAESSTWTSATTLDLSTFSGKSVKLRWNFDTVDGLFNNFEGWYVDDIKVTLAAASQPDYYSFTLAAGDSATLAMKALTGSITSLVLENGASNVLATASGTNNVDQLITDFVAPAGGTYYALVTSTIGTTYDMVVTKDAEFDNQNNSTTSTAQFVNSTTISGDQRVLSTIGSAAGTTVNTYRINAAAGATLHLSTSTPAGGSGQYVNTLDPRIRLLDSNGNQLAIDDNSAPDGRNALINFSVSAAATFYVEVSSTTASGTTGDYVLDISGANTSTVSPPTGAPALLATSDTGVSSSDGLTNLNNSAGKQLQFSVGQTIVNATVSIYANGTLIGSAVANGATTTVTTDGVTVLTDAIYTITARQTLSSKAQSADSSGITVQIDTAIPTAIITAVSPNPRTTPVSSMTITFSKQVFGLSLSGLTLTDNGGSNLLTGSQTLTSPDGITWTLGNLSGITTAAGTYTLKVAAGAAQSAAGDLSAVSTQTWQTNSTIAARSIFYNNSVWDGNDPTANANDLNAVATDKSALLPGGTATYSNLTNFSKGINGLMIDIANLPPNVTLTANDFKFAMGNNSDTTTWTKLAATPTITLMQIPASTTTHVDLTWPDGTIVDTWLQITVVADANTGLASNDIFYFGNLIGEVGNSPTQELVTAQDLVLMQLNTTGKASLQNVYDVNRDGRVTAQDVVLAQLNSFISLKLITPTGNGPAIQFASAPTTSSPGASSTLTTDPLSAATITLDVSMDDTSPITHRVLHKSRTRHDHA